MSCYQCLLPLVLKRILFVYIVNKSPRRSKPSRRNPTADLARRTVDATTASTVQCLRIKHEEIKAFDTY